MMYYHELGTALLELFGIISLSILWIWICFEVGARNEWSSPPVLIMLLGLPLLVGGIILWII